MKIIQEIQSINAEAETIITPDVAEADIKKILAYWTFVRKILLIVKIFTGAKADDKIDEFIVLGDKLYAEQNP